MGDIFLWIFLKGQLRVKPVLQNLECIDSAVSCNKTKNLVRLLMDVQLDKENLILCIKMGSHSSVTL